MSEEPQQLKATSANIVDEQKTKLKVLFPEVVTEGGKIDFDRLRLTLGESVDVGKERYGMNWPGKADCFKIIQQSSMATLVPARDESVNFDETSNLIIEGDNLETLKLLQKSYLGKVKMIYIDPPYNTGTDFIYPDNYTESIETYLQYTKQLDEGGRKLSTNTETDGRFHSKWLNMMYPRIFLARNLLCEDGIIFASIDDNEVTNLRRMFDEVFAEENFVAQIIWHSKYTVANDTRYMSQQHEYVLCYARNKESVQALRLPRTEEMNERYSNPDNDPKGAWKATPLHAKSGQGEPYTFTFKNGVQWKAPQGRFPRYSEQTLRRLDEEKRLWFGKNLQTTPSVKTYLAELSDARVSGDVWHFDEVGHTHSSNEELAAILGKGVFDNPKPTGLVKQAIQLCCGKNDIVLDFFAGSGTTAQAVLELNKYDGGSRKFLLIQLPEKTERKDYATIADITKERVRRVIKKLNNAEEKQLPFEPGKKHTQGFKVFKLQSSNFKAWNTEQPKDDTQLVKQLALHTDHLVEGRSQEDVLYELLLKSGFPLDTKVEKIILAEKHVFSVAEGAMLICLDMQLTTDVINAMAAQKPERVICLVLQRDIILYRSGVGKRG